MSAVQDAIQPGVLNPKLAVLIADHAAAYGAITAQSDEMNRLGIMGGAA